MLTTAQAKSDFTQALTECGEDLVFKPAGGTEARQILAIVSRHSRKKIDESGHMAPFAEISVLNDAADGISATEFNSAAARITIAERIGGTAVDRKLRIISDHDAAALCLEVI